MTARLRVSVRFRVTARFRMMASLRIRKEKGKCKGKFRVSSRD